VEEQEGERRRKFMKERACVGLKESLCMYICVYVYMCVPVKEEKERSVCETTERERERVE